MKKVLKWAGYLFLFIAILIIVGFLAWNSVSYTIIQKGAQVYAGRAGISLKIGRISGNLFSQTTIEHLKIDPTDDQPQFYDFKAQSITCTYDLWSLKEGFQNFLQGLYCTAENPEFSYDLRVSTAQDKPGDEQVPFFVPAWLPGFELIDGSVTLTHADWDADLKEISASLRSSGSVHELQLGVEEFRLNQEGKTRIDTGFTSLLHYAEDKLTVDSLEMGAEEIRAAGFMDLSRFDNDYLEFAAEVTFRHSQLNLKGLWANLLLQTNVRTDNFDITELLRRLGGSGWDIKGRIQGEADLAVNLKTREELTGSVTFNVQDGQLQGVKVESLSAAGRFDKNIFNVSLVEARLPGNHVLVKDLTIPMPLLQKGEALSILRQSQAEFSADISDVETLLQLFRIKDDVLPELVRPESLTVRGHLAEGILFLERAKTAAADLNLTIDRAAIPIPVSKEKFDSVPIDLAARIESRSLQKIAEQFGAIAVNGQAAADITINGSITNPEAMINLTGEDLSFKERQLGELSLQGDIRLVQEKPGVVQSFDFKITELTQENRTGILALLSPITGTWQDDRFSAAGTFQLDGKGEIAAEISREAGQEITMEISTRGLDSDGWLGNYIDASYFFHGADIEAVLLGAFENTQMQLSGIIREAGATDVDFPLTGSFNLLYSTKGIEISEFAWKSMERNQLTITGFLPYDPMAEKPFRKGELSLAGYIDFPSLEDVAVFLEPWGIGKGSVELDMELAGSWNEPQGHVLLQVENLEPPDRMRKFIESPVDITIDIAAQDDSIVLKSGSLESTQYAVQATGTWQHEVSVKELLRKGKGGLQGEVIGNAAVQLKDLNFLRRNLPWLRRLEGDMQGELHVSGPVTKPILNGSFSLKNAEASHTLNFPVLSAINLEGDFDENSIIINSMQAEVGGSPVALKGRINRENDVVTVNLRINGSNVLLFRNSDTLVRGDVQLSVDGPLEHLVLKGVTGLTGGYYTKNFDFLGIFGSSSRPVSEGVDFLFSYSDPPLSSAVLDIKITTIEPFKIRNNLMRGTLRPDLHLKGTGELPYLVGTIYIDPSRVLLPSGRLQVQSGLLRFLEGEPNRPKLDLLAHSKVLGYDINVVMQGPLNDPVITLNSSPALPNDELLLLLLTGQPPKDLAAGGTKASGTTKVMVYLGRDFLSKWLEDESGLNDETIFERFELDFGRDVTKSGEQTIETSFRLSEQTSSTGRVYYLTGEKDKYDAYNYGLKMVFRFE